MDSMFLMDPFQYRIFYDPKRMGDACLVCTQGVHLALADRLLSSSPN